MTFVTILSDDRDGHERLALTGPQNPFLAPEWGEARRSRGDQVIGYAVEGEEGLVGGALGVLRPGFIRRGLEIESVPRIDDPTASEVFWIGLGAWCSTHGVTDLVANTFASGAGATIPPLPGEILRSPRWEFVLPLQGEELRGRLRKSHRNRVNRGAREGLSVSRSTLPDALEGHLEAVFGSRARRRDRGEDVGGATDPDYFQAFVDAGAGEYFQAVCPEGRVLSWILVLFAEEGAYTHSSGATPEGMERSAAHFLRFEMSERLRADGLSVLHMGGVSDPASGLAEYKRGFGGTTVKLEKVSCYLGSAVRKKASTLVDLVRNDPLEIPRTLSGRVEKSLVFVADVDSFPMAPALPENWSMRYMTIDEIRSLESRDDELSPYAARFREREFSDAWGVWIDGELAHVSWLIPHEHDALLPVRNLKLQPGEAEITHAITASRFRGRGIFPVVIGQLMDLARKQGLNKVYALTGVGNTSSQRAITKAGFSRGGDIYRRVFQYLPGSPYVTWRGHRRRRSSE